MFSVVTNIQTVQSSKYVLFFYAASFRLQQSYYVKLLVTTMIWLQKYFPIYFMTHFWNALYFVFSVVLVMNAL